VEAQDDVAKKIQSLLESRGGERVPVIREAMQRLMTAKCSVFRNQNDLQQALTELR
jgi:succinate dehydrogenase/fumarate reductase flavoprotein subunit